MATGQNNPAIELLDQILSDLHSSLDTSSLNMFLSLRFQLSRNLNELLELAPRFTAGTIFTVGESTAKPGSVHAKQWFDADSVKIFNEALSSTRLYQAVLKNSLPPNLQKELIRAAWTRSILVENESAITGLLDELELYFPEIKGHLQSYMDAGNPESKQFALALLILRFPGLSPFLSSGIPARLTGYRPQTRLSGIDNLGNNWWCGFGISGAIGSRTGARRSFPYSEWAKIRDMETKRAEPTDFPAFLDAASIAEMQEEWNKLAALESAPSYLGKIVLNYARNHPRDTRIPEALHLVVKSTRYGCNDENSGKYSREAFQLLHKKYKSSRWTEKTPYWFN
jgi:hypothetical protein